MELDKANANVAGMLNAPPTLNTRAFESLAKPLIELAERTGLEPATPGVTGRYSNQLNYRSFCCVWWVL